MKINTEFWDNFHDIVEALDEYREDSCYEFSKIYGIDCFLKEIEKDIPSKEDYKNKSYKKHFKKFSDCFNASGLYSEDLVTLYKNSRIINSPLIGAFTQKSYHLFKLLADVDARDATLNAFKNEEIRKKFEVSKQQLDDLAKPNNYNALYLVRQAHWFCYFMGQLHDLDLRINRDGIKKTIESNFALGITFDFDAIEDGDYSVEENVEKACSYFKDALEDNNFDNGKLKNDYETFSEKLKYFIPFALEGEKEEDQQLEEDE